MTASAARRRPWPKPSTLSAQAKYRQVLESSKAIPQVGAEGTALAPDVASGAGPFQPKSREQVAHVPAQLIVLKRDFTVSLLVHRSVGVHESLQQGQPLP